MTIDRGDLGRESGWSAVRCLFRHTDLDDVFEERITVWKTSSLDEAIEKAEIDAVEYADAVTARYIGLAQGFRMFDDLSDGGEVFSLMRTSPLSDGDYIASFFATGSEFEAPS